MDGKELEIKALETRAVELQALQQEKFAEVTKFGVLQRDRAFVVAGLVLELGDEIEQINLRLIELCR